MSASATIYGRAAFDARTHTTQSGKAMATCRVAVDVTGRDASEAKTWWIDVLAFGRIADELERVEKGKFVSAMGRVTRGTYTTQAGIEREQWTLLADAIVTARTGRPGRRTRPSDQGPPRTTAQEPPPAEFDDSLPF